MSILKFEVPAGAIDGENKVFKLVADRAADAAIILVANGTVLTPVDSYSLDANTVTLKQPLSKGDSILAYYIAG